MERQSEINEWFYQLNEYFMAKIATARTHQWRIEDKINQLPEECSPVDLQDALLINTVEQQHYNNIITRAIAACDEVNTLIASHTEEARREQDGDIWRTEERAVEMKEAMSKFYDTQHLINTTAGVLDDPK
jgi:hypothetical protein